MTTSWAVFRGQFEAAAEDNCWTSLEKATYFITALQGRATDMQHGVQEVTTYENTLEALEDRFGEKFFAAAHRSQLKPRTQWVG
jgi:hypothetical protein